MAQRQDLTNDGNGNPFYIGTSLTITFRMIPVTNIFGWTTYVTFKRNITDTTYIKQYTPTTVDVTTGIVSITMSAADTQLFAAPGTYQYDWERTDSGAEAVMTIGTIQFAQKVK